jgi:glycosyltransferase involved in cell wall biosynthesis
MHVYLLNWRDIKHPRKGGAEVLTHGIFARLVERGHRVTWFGSDFPGAAKREVIDGIEVLRGGNAVSVRAHAYAHYRSMPQADVVVDEINTLPFLAPLYARVPVVAFICQLAREVWFYEAPAGAAQLGYAIEPLYLAPYRAVPTMTISESSKASLRDEVHFRGPIGVMPMAIDQYEPAPPFALTDRDDEIVALGRVTPSKRLDQSIRALALLDRPPLDRLRLRIIGGGSDALRREMDALACALGVGDRIVWSGFVDENEKRRLLSRAKALVMTSVREGWGLAVTEANLAGTPAVGYDILGLKDSIRNGETGLTTEESPRALSEALIDLVQDEVRYATLARAAQCSARSLTWEQTTSFVETFLKDIVSSS